MPLFGLGLEALRAWLAVLPTYAKSNEHKLVFPTERGKRRLKIPPRSWPKVVEKFGKVARIGREPWWHLLRHTCASSLISGAWGMRWKLEDVSKMLGHTSVKTTEIYAHLAPTAVQKTATEAQDAWSLGCHAVVMPPAAVTSNLPILLGTPGPTRTDDIRRPTEALKSGRNLVRVAAWWQLWWLPCDRSKRVSPTRFDARAMRSRWRLAS